MLDATTANNIKQRLIKIQAQDFTC